MKSLRRFAAFALTMPVVAALSVECLLAQETAAADEVDSFDIAAETGEGQGKETPLGQTLEDRILGRSLVEYGLRANTPEAIVSGVQVLVDNPAAPVAESEVKIDEAADDERDQLLEYLEQARAMRPADETLGELVARAEDLVREKKRGLAGGPKRWQVTLDKGDYYGLDPRLIYNAQEKAIVHAYCSDDATLGIRVRRSDQRNYVTQAVSRKDVTATWNSGIYTSGWVVRIYNLSGPDKLAVVIETN